MDDFNNYKTVKKAVKIFMGETEKIERLSAEFERTHNVIDIKQKCSTIIFIFYLIEVDLDNVPEDEK